MDKNMIEEVEPTKEEKKIFKQKQEFIPIEEAFK